MLGMVFAPAGVSVAKAVGTSTFIRPKSLGIKPLLSRYGKAVLICALSPSYHDATTQADSAPDTLDTLERRSLIASSFSAVSVFSAFISTISAVVASVPAIAALVEDSTSQPWQIWGGCGFSLYHVSLSSMV